jgi:uncharacterized membrane protein YdbT with pleckstrin-like domain
MEQTEQSIWEGSPSQVLNVPIFVVCALLCWLVVPIFYAVWRWLVLKNIRYELTTERLKLREGVLNKRLDEIELYRVRDYTLEQPLLIRIFGLSNITLGTADPSQPVVVLRAIADGERVLDQLRRHVEDARVKKRVLPLDFAPS